MTKRKDYISWDEYFMGVAVLSSMRSKDPNTQVGRASSTRRRRSWASATTACPSG